MLNLNFILLLWFLFSTSTGEPQNHVHKQNNKLITNVSIHAILMLPYFIISKMPLNLRHIIVLCAVKKRRKYLQINHDTMPYFILIAIVLFYLLNHRV